MSAQPAVLMGTQGQFVPLQRVRAHGRLNGLLFEVTVEQQYCNETKDCLESIYTFPLPLHAVLLGLDLEISGRTLRAVVTEKTIASSRYENAIDDGNTAALVESHGGGLYSVSLGNLNPGDTVTIRYRYAQLLDAHGSFARINVPTVIAPRYGDPRDSGLDGPTVPSADVLREYPFDIHVELVGVTDADAVRSPSHAVVKTATADGLSVALERQGFLDRDFVLEIDRIVIANELLIASDGDAFVVLASPVLQEAQPTSTPLALKVVVDCSGSMAGDSIAAARNALLDILDRLGPDDLISITRFGSRVEQVTDGLEHFDELSAQALRSVVGGIQADLGGTEMASGLRAALAIPVPPRVPADVILITDGEIHKSRSVAAVAAKSGHRLFCVAIGAAPNEALARELAEVTGGACEFVSAGQPADDVVLRTFKRLRTAPHELVGIRWPREPLWSAPPASVIFPGDTVHLVAGFSKPPEGSFHVAIRMNSGNSREIEIPIRLRRVDGDLIPRIAAARRLRAVECDAAIALALKYQLTTNQTSLVVVAERADEERARGLPVTISVPHMLAAGWGGTGRGVRPSHDALSLIVDARPAFQSVESRRHPSARRPMFESHASGLRRETEPEYAVRFLPTERLAVLTSICNARSKSGEVPQKINQLVSEHRCPSGVAEELLRIIVEARETEEEVVEAFLVLLITTSPDDVDLAALSILARELGPAVVGSTGKRKLRSLLRARFFTTASGQSET